MRFLASLALTVVAASAANAQNLSQYNFFGQAGNQATGIGTAASGLTAGAVTRVGPATFLPTTATNTFSAIGWSTALTAATADTYMTFSLSTNSTTTASISSVTALVNRGGNGPRLVEFQYSLNGGAFQAGTDISVPNASAVTTATQTYATPITLGVSQNVVFRLYGFDANNNNSQDIMALESATNTTNALVVVGSFTPVPEPTTMLGLSALGVFGMGLIRKRFKK